MKREELEALGLSKEQVDSVLNLHHNELSPVKKELEDTKEELETEKGKVEAHQGTIDGLKEDLKKFDGVDVTALNERIGQLEKDIKQKETEYTQQIADRDFNDILRESINAANGINVKAITALLDVDALKASKNQKDDIANAIKALTEAEDSKMLFGEAAPNPVGKVTVIPGITPGQGNESTSTLKDALKEEYNK